MMGLKHSSPAHSGCRTSRRSISRFSFPAANASAPLPARSRASENPLATCVRVPVRPRVNRQTLMWLAVGCACKVSFTVKCPGAEPAPVTLPHTPFHGQFNLSLVFRWLLDLVDDECIHRPLGCIQFQSELLFERRKQ